MREIISRMYRPLSYCELERQRFANVTLHKDAAFVLTA